MSLNFLRLHDPLLSVLFEDDDIIAIDKPYGYNAHTNDSKIAHSDFIQDGLIEIFEKNRGHKLHIIHRLDQTTTGVMIFGKSMDAAKKYAEFFFQRQVKKTYWFITKKESNESSFIIDQNIIHKGKELSAKTELFFLKKTKNFSLWQAKPLTGRNHQIRIHAQKAGISILGDEKYAGAPYSFLCLHNHRIEFPNGIVIEAKAPAYFENLSLLDDMALARAYFEIDRRLRLYSSAQPDQCFRLIHSQNSATDLGYHLDQFGKILILHWHRENWSTTDEKRFTLLAEALHKPLLVRFSDKNYLSFPAEKIPEKWIVKESDRSYEIHSSSYVGLFTNQRLQREWVAKNSHSKSVLNLFSQTGTYSVAAARSGALQVTSVETNKAALTWSRTNFKLNSEPLDKSLFLLRDSLTFLDQCLNKNLKYDLIICDAPSFMRCEKGFFKIEQSLEELLTKCISSLNPEGEFLFSTSFEDFYIDTILKIILKVQSQLKLARLEVNCLLASLDYELPDQKTNLKSFLIRT